MRGKHIECKCHLIISDIVSCEDVAKIASTVNLTNPFTKTLPQKMFESHLEGMSVMNAKLNLIESARLLRIMP